MNEDLKYIIDNYVEFVYKIAYFNLNNRFDVDDVVQDVYLKVLDNINKIDKDKVKAWLSIVTRNTAKNYNKRFWRRKVSSLEEDTCIVSKEFEEEIITIKENIKILNDTYKDTFILYVKGYTNKEISKKLKISEDCVRKRVERAKEIIKCDVFDEGEIHNGK